MDNDFELYSYYRTECITFYPNSKNDMVAQVEIFRKGKLVDQRLLETDKGVVLTHRGVMPCKIRKNPITSKFHE